MEGRPAVVPRYLPAVFSGGDSVLAACRRGDGYAVGIGQGHAGLRNGQGPDPAGGIRDRIAIQRRTNRGNPAAVQRAGGHALRGHENVFPGGQLLFSAD